jgi:hypothetical protein
MFRHAPFMFAEREQGRTPLLHQPLLLQAAKIKASTLLHTFYAGIHVTRKAEKLKMISRVFENRSRYVMRQNRAKIIHCFTIAD